MSERDPEFELASIYNALAESVLEMSDAEIEVDEDTERFSCRDCTRGRFAVPVRLIGCGGFEIYFDINTAVAAN